MGALAVPVRAGVGPSKVYKSGLLVLSLLSPKRLRGTRQLKLLRGIPSARPIRSARGLREGLDSKLFALKPALPLTISYAVARMHPCCNVV